MEEATDSIDEDEDEDDSDGDYSSGGYGRINDEEAKTRVKAKLLSLMQVLVVVFPASVVKSKNSSSTLSEKIGTQWMQS